MTKEQETAIAPAKRTSKRRRRAEEFQLPPLTVTWKQCEEAWASLGSTFSAIALVECEGGKLDDRFFAERLVYDPNLDVLHVRFFHDYEVDTQGITEPMHLVRWVLHFCGKTWMNVQFIDEFIKKVCAIKGWNPYGL
jgi:hypothetical protein